MAGRCRFELPAHARTELDISQERPPSPNYAGENRKQAEFEAY